MRNLIRKNYDSPSDLDAERFSEILTRIRTHPDRQSKRVEAVLELMSRFRADLSTREKMTIFTRLRLILETYRWTVSIRPKPEGFHVVHVMANKYEEGTSEADRWEHETIGLLLDRLPYLGKRPRIRRCADTACAQWFFAAKREDQEFCCGTCRQHHYDSNPEMRRKKREYMRKRRVQDRQREEASKRAVGFRGRVKLIIRRKRDH